MLITQCLVPKGTVSFVSLKPSTLRVTVSVIVFLYISIQKKKQIYFYEKNVRPFFLLLIIIIKSKIV